MCSSGDGVHDVGVQATPETLAKHLKISKFTSSSSWLHFCRRQNICNNKICCQLLSADVQNAEPF
jgi:hypothetical protein